MLDADLLVAGRNGRRPEGILLGVFQVRLRIAPRASVRSAKSDTPTWRRLFERHPDQAALACAGRWEATHRVSSRKTHWLWSVTRRYGQPGLRMSSYAHIVPGLKDYLVLDRRNFPSLQPPHKATCRRE